MTIENVILLLRQIRPSRTSCTVLLFADGRRKTLRLALLHTSAITYHFAPAYKTIENVVHSLAICRWPTKNTTLSITLYFYSIWIPDCEPRMSAAVSKSSPGADGRVFLLQVERQLYGGEQATFCASYQGGGGGSVIELKIKSKMRKIK